MEVSLKQPMALVCIATGTTLMVNTLFGAPAAAGWLTGLGITLLWVGD